MGYIVIDDTYREFGLSLTELVIFSTIAGYSQNGYGCFYGSRSVLAQSACCKSLRTVDAALNNMMKSGLIVKGPVTIGNEAKQAYWISPDLQPIAPLCKNCTGGEQILHTDNLSNNKENNKEKSIPNGIDTKKEEKSLAEKIADLQKSFRETLMPFVDKYSKDMLQHFADYWAAPLQNPTPQQIHQNKLLYYQTQPTWYLEGRLRTWASRDKTATSEKPDYVGVNDIWQGYDKIYKDEE